MHNVPAVKIKMLLPLFFLCTKKRVQCGHSIASSFILQTKKSTCCCIFLRWPKIEAVLSPFWRTLQMSGYWPTFLDWLTNVGHRSPALSVQNDLSLFYQDGVQTYVCRVGIHIAWRASFHSRHWTAGLIWSRYSLVIIPKNWNLFCVNFFLGCAGGSQLYRIWRFVRQMPLSAPSLYHIWQGCSNDQLQRYQIRARELPLKSQLLIGRA